MNCGGLAVVFSLHGTQQCFSLVYFSLHKPFCGSLECVPTGRDSFVCLYGAETTSVLCGAWANPFVSTGVSAAIA